jgi:hypothetical protein
LTECNYDTLTACDNEKSAALLRAAHRLVVHHLFSLSHSLPLSLNFSLSRALACARSSRSLSLYIRSLHMSIWGETEYMRSLSSSSLSSYTHMRSVSSSTRFPHILSLSSYSRSRSRRSRKSRSGSPRRTRGCRPRCARRGRTRARADSLVFTRACTQPHVHTFTHMRARLHARVHKTIVSNG